MALSVAGGLCSGLLCSKGSTHSAASQHGPQRLGEIVRQLSQTHLPADRQFVSPAAQLVPLRAQAQE